MEVDRLREFANQSSSAALVFFGILAIGAIIDQILYRIMRGRSKKKAWVVGEALAHALHGLPTSLGLITAVHFSALRLDLATNVRGFIGTGVEVAYILVLTAFSARIVGRVIRAYLSRADAKLPSSSIFVNLGRGLVWILGGLVLLAALGISIAPMIAALGVGGLALGLALQPTLENAFSGIQVLLSKQIQPGDFVQLETGQEGWVQDVTWRNTTIKKLSNDLVIVPNAILGKSLVTNYSSQDAEHVVWVNVGVAYDSDLELVERVTCETAAATLREVDSGVGDYEPLFRFEEFGDSSINMRVSLRAETYADRWPLRHEMIKRLHARFAEEGIEIPFPQRVIHGVGERAAEET